MEEEEEEEEEGGMGWTGMRGGGGGREGGEKEGDGAAVDVCWRFCWWWGAEDGVGILSKDGGPSEGAPGVNFCSPPFSPAAGSSLLSTMPFSAMRLQNISAALPWASFLLLASPQPMNSKPGTRSCKPMRGR